MMRATFFLSALFFSRIWPNLAEPGRTWPVKFSDRDRAYTDGIFLAIGPDFQGILGHV